MSPAVHVRSLTRRFGNRAVLDGIDLQIGRGEFVALLGRSGSGKSTLLRVLADLDREVDGQVDIPDRQAVVFQDARLLPWMRVLDNVILGLDRPDATARGQAMLDEVGLGDRHADWPATLSGGEAQRAALARALVREPDLLLLDEPFGALDALTRITMHTLLARLCAAHRPAVFLVTHDVDEAILLADRVLVLDRGRFALDLDVRMARPRKPQGDAFAALRARLLGALGVEQT